MYSSTNKVYVWVSSTRIFLQLDKNEQDIAFIKTLHYYRYNYSERYWIITNTPENRESIKAYFGKRLYHKVENEKPLAQMKAATIVENEIHIIEHIKGRLKVIAHYNQELVDLMHTFPYSFWDEENRWWTTIHTEGVLNQIKKYAEANGLVLRFFDKSTTTKGRLMKNQIPNYRTCPKEYIEKLEIMRYSPNTIKTYISNFEEFINYFYYKKPQEISEKEILEFIRYLVTERGVSISYQNVSINAIKFYYEKVLMETKKFYTLDRPRKEKVLPTVLSKEEVMSMIRVTKNIKHKAIVMMLYSAGLRVGELCALKISDIDSKRGMVIIRHGKGKKDRTSLLSEKMLLILREYYKLYRPEKYLFEGGLGGSYSSSSVQKIVKRAARQVGIRKDVTPHTLRHSFATHLLEQGVNLRYIQTLLGHESSKTTEIYTHIRNDKFEDIDNPLDSMDFDNG